MTLYEKGKELGIKESLYVRNSLTGCPSHYPELHAKDDMVICRNEACDLCWGREYVGPVDTMRHFDTGAVRDDATGKGRYDLLPWGAIHALAQHCERGAVHYGERNVDKGIPQHSLIDSGLRHLGLYIQGDAEPHHLVAALWNIAWAVEQELKRPELIDLPERTEASGQAA